MKSRTAASVLRTIADDKSTDIFLTIYQSGGIDSVSLKRKTKLTRKQYYSRLSNMKRAGLVRRKEGKYVLTAFGKIVYEAQAAVGEALTNFWKFKAVDVLDMSKDLPTEEQHKLTKILFKK